jgi:CBS domain containing-hemolysin-like protein
VNSLLQLSPFFAAMILLMACSAFFSASEVALFYLQPRDRRAMASGTPGEQAAISLLQDPDQLLSAVLFWNLLINVTYFALASICSINIEKDPALGRTGAILFALLSLLAIIFFCEMFPKSVGVLMPRRLARALSLPLTLAVRAVGPLMPILRSINLISTRLLWPGFTPEPSLDVADLERAIEHSGNDESLIRQEQAVLQNIVRLSNIRVEEWMRPRAQFRTFKPPVGLADLAGSLPASGYLLITEPDGREIEKAIRLDNQFQLPNENLERLAEPVLYLPWCATVAGAFEKMSHRDREVTVVVNEYGETIGILSIEDILETVFTYSPSRTQRLLDLPPLEEIEPGKWRVVGLMSLNQFSRRLNLETPETSSVTVGGVIQETLQRLAEPGDRCQWGPCHFEVIDAPQRGTMLVELTIHPAEGEPT